MVSRAQRERQPWTALLEGPTILWWIFFFWKPCYLSSFWTHSCRVIISAASTIVCHHSSAVSHHSPSPFLVTNTTVKLTVAYAAQPQWSHPCPTSDTFARAFFALTLSPCASTLAACGTAFGKVSSCRFCCHTRRALHSLDPSSILILSIQSLLHRPIFKVSTFAPHFCD